MKSNRSFVTPIHREAREAAERAIVALRELHAADPFVFVSLLEAIDQQRIEALRDGGYDPAGPMATRSLLRFIRERTHAMKLRAVEESSRLGAESARQKVAS